ncbi:MAG: VCBS repeat-containing protein [Rhodothermaceae bacterium]|nr:VCBS repeat-containing protein [Rhodothermaceae bacterium]
MASNPPILIRVLVCAAIGWLISANGVQAQSISFEDLSEQAGVLTDEGVHGIAVADYNNDGWDDIYLGTEGSGSTLLLNQKNGVFLNATKSSGLEVAGTVLSPLWGDINNDGYLDLFVGKRDGDVTCQLFLGSPDGVFEEITDQSGIRITDEIGSATFGDYNMDGRIDLFIATRGSEDYLFENVHESSSVYFNDVSERAGVGGEAFALPMQATWVDYDGDHDVDLFAVHDGNLKSRFYQNNSFFPLIEVSSSSKLQVSRSSMGVAWGDYNNDGWPDAYVTNIDQGNLFKNLGNGRFEDVTIESGSGLNGMSWGVVFVDFDNDGDEDLFIGNTYDFDGRRSFLYENKAGAFENIARDAGVALSTNTFGVATGDFNKDGLMDLVVGDDSGGNKLLLNTSAVTNNWVHLTLEGDTYNRMAVGATANLYADGERYTRTVYAGSSYRSQISPTLHVGLGQAEVIDSLVIHWGKDATEAYYELEVNRDYGFVQNKPLRVEVEQSGKEELSEIDVVHYPHPSFSNVTFKVSVPAAERVRIEIYDAIGRKIETLMHHELSAGVHRIVLDSSAYRSGIYFYKLHSNTSIKTGKMIVVH